MPKALRDRPVLPPDLAFYKRLFTELSDSRSYTQHGQPLPIPISELVSYCEMFGIKQLSERQTFFRVIRALDRAYVDVSAERMKQQQATDNKAPPAVAP